MSKLPLIGWSTVLATALSLLMARAHPFGEPGLYALNATPAESTIAADPIRGKALFERRCTGCHALTTDREGPRLEGVFGRRAASIPGFPYSAALRQSQIVWNEQSLDHWLTDPGSFLPNSNMDFRVPKPQERKDLIAYLSTMPPPP